MIVSVGGTSLGYDDVGSGPPVVFVMGLTASRYHWLGFHARFADSFRVVTLDNRGVGESSTPPGPYSIRQMAGDVLGLMDHLGLASASLVGVSMGGMIAQEVALEAPSRVDRLVLGCTHGGGAEIHPPEPVVIERFSGVGKGGARQTVRGLIEVNLSDEYAAEHPEVVDALVEHGMTHKMSPMGFYAQLGALTGHDAAPRLDRIACPTLIVTGDRDRLVPHGNSLALHQRIAGSRLQVLPGAGHMWWVEQADAIEPVIRAFLAGDRPA